MAYLLDPSAEACSKDILVFQADSSEIPEDLLLASPKAGEVAARAQVTLQEAFEKLKPSLRKVVHWLSRLSPDQAIVEFGLKMGAIIPRVTAEVSFTVSLSL